MKKKFKKIMSVIGSVAIVGSTIGFAMAAGGAFPSPFVQNSNADYAIVYGANAAASDVTAANSINTYLNTFYSTETDTNIDTSTTIITSDFSSSVGVTEDEVELGGSIVGGKITSTISDNKITSLLDEEIRWDDGVSSKNYDIHEEIRISDMELLTTFDNDEFNSSVVLTNDNGIEYRYVFDDTLNTNRIGDEDADALELTILGKDYEILDMDSDSIKISLSKEKTVTVGQSIVVEGVTLTINDIFGENVEVNGVLIKEGRKKTVKGIEVYVDTVAYHSLNSALPSKAILKVGKDIEQNIDDGDEYYEDETWEWSIVNPGDAEGYIGIKYVRKSIGYDEDDTEDNAIGPGQSYILPENYGAVSFEGLTDVNYDDFELSFDDKKIYKDDIGNTNDLFIIEGENDDSITLAGGIETDSLYFRYNNTEGTAGIDQVEMYFKDINGDIDDDHEGRVQYKRQFDFNSTQTDIARLIVDDTEIKVGWNNRTLTLTNNDGVDINVLLGVSDGNFDRLGDEEEDAENDDIIVDGKSIGTREDDVMDHYGIIIKDPENYADDDSVLLKVPNEQIYGTISILGQGESITTTEDVNETNATTTTPTPIPNLGGVIIKDTEIASVKDKNLILVGGSCINAEVAKLLGGKTCGGEFTLQTGVIAGKALIQTFTSSYNISKIAVVIAGYNAADTTKGINSVINSDVNLVVGQKVIV